MKKIQDVLDEVDLDVNELPAPTQKRVQTYANLEKQLIAAKLELEALDEPNPEKQEMYEDAINYFNNYEEDVIQSIQAYANRLEQELHAKAMKEKRDSELKVKENEARIKARKEAEEKEKKAKEEISVAQAVAQAEAEEIARLEKEKARLEEEGRKLKKKSGGLGIIFAGLGIVAAIVTFGASRDK